jgi:(R,R)-butanediol dehydrogenase/meso-butanediol dehydrogenase/diacetyl reductase
MRAAVLRGRGEVCLENIPEPRPADDEVLLRVGFAGICGTDLHEYAVGPEFSRPPVVLGHEMAGTIVEFGGAIDDVTAGQRVAVIPMDYCRRCYYCLRDLYHLCDQPSWIGFTRNGGLANYVAVPRRLVVPIPDAVPLELAALTEPVAVAYHAIRRSQVRVGDHVLVLGAGALGLSVLQCALAAGVDDVVVVEKRAGRAQMARELGAAEVLSDTSDAAERVRERTSGVGADVVFDAAGNQGAFDIGLDCLRKRGRFVEIASWAHAAKVDTNRHLIAEKEILLVFGYEMYDDFPSVLGLMAHGRLSRLQHVITHIGLSQIVEQGLNPLLSGSGDQVKIMVKPDGELAL